MFWYEWSENHNFSPIQSQTSQGYTQVVTTIKIRHSGLASLCMCTTSFESSKSNISWTPGVIFLCVRSREPTIDIWRRGLSQHEIFPYFCSALSMDIFFLLSFRQHNTELDFSQKSKKLSFFAVKYFFSQLFIPRNWTKLGKILVFCLERGATPESWSVIVGSIYNNETY